MYMQTVVVVISVDAVVVGRWDAIKRVVMLLLRLMDVGRGRATKACLLTDLQFQISMEMDLTPLLLLLLHHW